MTITMTVNGESYTAVPTAMYKHMVKQLGHTPALPKPAADGTRPALATGRAILARRMIKRRLAAGWTQEELAKRAKVRIETISRLEAGRHMPQRATLLKLEDVFKAHV